MLKKAKGDQAIITPSFYRPFNRSVAKSVIIAFVPQIFDKVLEGLGYDKKKGRTIIQSKYYPPPDKELPGLVGPAVGASAAATLLEVLIVLGAKKIVGFGLCGSIVGDLSIGEIFIPKAAMSEEGTSPHYFPDKKLFATSSLLTQTLENYLQEQKEPYRFGPVWTTDAIFRETAEKVESYGKKGVMAVEMETSALCAVAEYRKVDYSALMVVSDELASLRWNPGFKRPKLKRATSKAIKLLAGFRF